MEEKPNLSTKEYKDFIYKIKESINRTKYSLVRKLNTEITLLYYEIGRLIVEKQKLSSWGDGLIVQMEKDLNLTFPDIKGFSRINLFYMKRLYLLTHEYKNVPQLVAQLPWGHVRLLIDKVKDFTGFEFYTKKTIENSWSRAVLDHQISLGLYKRQGKILNNFNSTVKAQDLDLLKESFKESYVLDFLDISTDMKERDLEKLLIKNITKFILELGRGFAFVGKQFKLDVGNQEFFIDLLFYNYILNRFIIIELKNTDFKPEYVGQLSFYVSAVNRNIKGKKDKDSVGLLICKGKNKTIVECSLENIKGPIGVAEYKIISELSKDLKNFLP